MALWVTLGPSRHYHLIYHISADSHFVVYLQNSKNGNNFSTMEPVFYDHLSSATTNYGTNVAFYLKSTCHLGPTSMEQKGGRKPQGSLLYTFSTYSQLRLISSPQNTEFVRIIQCEESTVYFNIPWSVTNSSEVICPN